MLNEQLFGPLAKNQTNQIIIITHQLGYFTRARDEANYLIHETNTVQTNNLAAGVRNSQKEWKEQAERVEGTIIKSGRNNHKEWKEQAERV